MLANASSIGESGTPKHRLPSAERKAAIVKAAFELFAKNGFRGTTTREIAAAVGVSEPVLYQHFVTKRELYTAIIDKMIESGTAEDIRRLEDLGNGVEDRAFFTELAQHILRWYLQDTSRIRLLLFSALEGHELAELWQQRVSTRFLGFVEQYIARRAASGAFFVADPPVAARYFTGAVGQYGLMRALFQCPPPARTQDEVVDEFVTLFLQSIRAGSR